ncbi:MAG: DPP IV N-terminal domain-containing protein [Ignavibacteria bacterium]
MIISLRFSFIILISGISFAQKDFTLRQVILEYETISPAKLKQLQWIPGTDDFSFVKKIENKITLLKENAFTGDKQVLFTFNSLNELLKIKELPLLDSLPKLNWINQNTIQFWTQNYLLNINVDNSTIKIVNNVAEEGENKDFIRPSKIAYTIDNNLFIAINSEQVQVTNDEDKGIVNGQFVHRHEFGITKGTFWSPRSNYLAFYRKDERMVSDYPVIDVSVRPAVVKNIKYPMAGMPSEEVTVGVYNLKSKKTVWLQTGEPKDHYLPGVTWSPDEKYIYILELNRDQNHMQLTKYNVKSGKKIKVLIEETNEKYVEPMTGLIFFENEPDMFIHTSRMDGWNHLYLYDAQGRKIKQLTNGEWEVTDFDGISSVGYNIFFTATEQSPIERHYYKIDLDRYEMKRITSRAGYHDVVRNKKGTIFLDVFEDLNTPQQVTLLDKNGEIIREVYSAPDPFKGYNACTTELFTLKNSDGFDLYCRKILPPDFDENKKYPVMVYVYGGPHSQKVRNKWIGNAKLWFHYMAQQGFIVFTLDNRGTNFRGFDFEQTTFLKLGTVEIEDQLVGVEYLKSLPYVDENRMGVYGWSYGGFMSTGLMTRTPGVFQVGVAGGAVIDWSYYEVMYTERYMGTPETNPDGYNETNLLNYVQNLEGKLLHVHGTSDPTVVWQHTLMYCDKAAELGIQIDYFPYIDHKHHVKGTDELHIYQKMINYFLENLSN